MIRVFELFRKFNLKNISAEDLFLKSMAEFNPYEHECPLCGTKHPDWEKHATYERYMISFEKGHVVTYLITVIRYKCPSCGHTHAILPECLFPYRSYSFLFILAVMRDYYTRSLRKVAQKPLKMPDGREILYNYNTFEKWEGLYKKKGMDGLMPKQRSDAGLSRALPDTAIEEIFRLKQQFPRINATLIYTKLIADGFIKQSEVSVSIVQRFIKKNDLKSARNPNIKDRKAFEEEFPCNMYQADTSHSIYITENGIKQKTYLIFIVDDHSRMIVGARFFYNDNAYNFQIVLKEAIARYGLCNKLYTDHGSPYYNEQLTLILGSLGIIEIHAPIRDGALKAKVERAFGVVKGS